MWCQFLSIQLPNMLIIYAVLLLCNTFYSNLGFVMFYSTDFAHQFLETTVIFKFTLLYNATTSSSPAAN